MPALFREGRIESGISHEWRDFCWISWPNVAQIKLFYGSATSNLSASSISLLYLYTLENI
jgi:hypothetical protein